MTTSANYNAPLILPKGFFHGRWVPTFPDYVANYYIHYLRYLYFLCIMGANDDAAYPSDMKVADIERAFKEHEKSGFTRRARPIHKILLAEAPPPTERNYFYNPSSPWNSSKGKPGRGGAAYSGAIQKTLFPKRKFSSKIDFLRACAKEGFLIIDLFPYAISYSGSARRSAAYQAACISAFGGGATPYPINFCSVLENLKFCLQESITIGFALTSFGRIILTDTTCVKSFDHWCFKNGISLNPIGSIGITALPTTTPPSPSGFTRVCHRRGLFGPDAGMMSRIGF